MLYTLVYLLYSSMMCVFNKKSFLFWVMFLMSVSLFVFFLKGLGMGLVLTGANQFYPFFLDWVSFLLLALSIMVVVLSLLSSLSHVPTSQMSLYFFLMALILVVLFFFFLAWNVVLMFFMFEFVLFPMLLIIGIWGSQVERVVANYYFFFYTLISSMPLLLLVLMLLLSGFSMYFNMLLNVSFVEVSFLFSMSFLLAFMCKLPAYGVHIWLPKAHVEAPVSGSMVLAGLLLKMGGYGILRYFSVALLVSVSSMNFMFIMMLIGLLFPMLICFRQVDIKSFIAYSSVGHMCVAIASLLTYMVYGITSALVIFLVHSLVSPAMFNMGNLVYERTSSRSVLGMSGFEKGVGSFLFFFFFFWLSNMSFPPLASFFAEVMIYVSMVGLNYYFLLVLFFFMLVSSVVMFSFMSKLNKGKENLASFVEYLTFRELFVLFIFCVMVILMLFLFFIL